VEAGSTSVNFYEIVRRNIPEDCHVHIRRREHLKFHVAIFLFLGNSQSMLSMSMTRVTNDYRLKRIAVELSLKLRKIGFS
jgi:hypothetical protein